MSMIKTDICIIGAGSGGYACALRAAQLGFRVAVVDRREAPGGTCLHIGCIPSKALLEASHKYEEAKHDLNAFGIHTGKVSFDLNALMAHKNAVIESNVKGIAFLFKKQGITWIQGTASIPRAGQVRVGETLYTASHIIIATGSEPISLPQIPIDEERILSSTGALSLQTVPKTLCVIGGGYIGLELGCVWQRLGAQVRVIEYLDRLVPNMDQDISAEMLKILKKQGIGFDLNTQVIKAERGKKDVKLTLAPRDNPTQTQDIHTDLVLVAVGRRAFTEGLGLESLGLNTDSQGKIPVNERFETSIKGIYAIGDVIAGPMLAHKAQEEGTALAEYLAGQKPHLNHALIPGVVYTHPEAAQVGLSEHEAQAQNIPYKIGKFPFSANGRARAMHATQGFVKLIAHAHTDQLLGAHIIGAQAGTLISELTLAMEFSASAEDIARTTHPHPTLSEIIKEAALALGDGALHV